MNKNNLHIQIDCSSSLGESTCSRDSNGNETHAVGDPIGLWVSQNLLDQIVWEANENNSSPTKETSFFPNDNNSPSNKISPTKKRSFSPRKKKSADGSVYKWVYATYTLSSEKSSQDGKDLSEDEGVDITIKDKNSKNYNNKTIRIPHSVFHPKKMSNTSLTTPPGNASSSSVERKTGILMANKGTNTSNERMPHDLGQLTHLHEPAMVHTLLKRYEKNEIYTFAGPVLLAVNPFKKCIGLYEQSTMESFLNRDLSRQPVPCSSSSISASSCAGSDVRIPHVFDTADNAYANMMIGLEQVGITPSHFSERAPSSCTAFGNKIDQSVLVSGESGAGKTVSAKHIMSYLAILSLRKSASFSSNRMSRKSIINSAEQRVLRSNPILQSLGNACTTQNNNSSRFGKFVELQFNHKGSLIGGCIETYLLEKVRLVHQNPGERNFHIFYEMLAGLENNLKRDLFLSGLCPKDFKITSLPDTHEKVEDISTHREFHKALLNMNFCKDEIRNIYEVTAAVMHLGNLTFQTNNSEESSTDANSKAAKAGLSLLGLKGEALNKAICYREISIGGDTFSKALPKELAQKRLEALITSIYKVLFDYIVNAINSFISKTDPSDEESCLTSENSQKVVAFIGILDIFGFEIFESNGFEQLCINYANEALQQSFNLFVFDHEQQEYEVEGIDWTHIGYPDNSDIIKLIDSSSNGLLPLLNDMCKIPGATDSDLAKSTYKRYIGHERFYANRTQQANNQFVLNHYASPVEYDLTRFIEKNKDDMPKESTRLLLSSSNMFVRTKLGELFRSTSDKKRKKTLSGQFVSQLRKLQSRISLTHPHYVRCLRPNNKLEPNHFDRSIIATQLAYTGVLEVIRISRLGYSQRYSFENFLRRYRFLSQDIKKSESPREQCIVLTQAIERMWNEEHPQKTTDQEASDDVSYTSGVQTGYTKVFVRYETFLYLENVRRRLMDKAVLKIQAFLHKHYIILKRSKNLAATVIQSKARQYVATQNLKRMRQAACICQTFWRFVRQKHPSISSMIQLESKSQQARQKRRKERRQSLWEAMKKIENVNLALKAAEKLEVALEELKYVSRERDQLKEENSSLRQELMNAMDSQRDAASVDSHTKDERDDEYESEHSIINKRTEEELVRENLMYKYRLDILQKEMIAMRREMEKYKDVEAEMKKTPSSSSPKLKKDECNPFGSSCCFWTP